MDTSRLRTGHLLSFAGAAAALGSLWAPWFQLSFADLAHQLIGNAPSSQAANTISAAQGLLPHTLHVTAWRVFHWADIEIAALSVLVMFFVLAVTGVFGSTAIGPKRAGWYSLRAGVVMGLQTGYQVFYSHGPGGIVHPAWGAWLCFGAVGAIILGGLWASMGDPMTVKNDAFVATPQTDHWAAPEAPVALAGAMMATAPGALAPAPLTPVYAGLRDPSTSVAPPGMR